MSLNCEFGALTSDVKNSILASTKQQTQRSLKKRLNFFYKIKTLEKLYRKYKVQIFFIVYEYFKISEDPYEFLQIYSSPYFKIVKNRIYMSPSIITTGISHKPISIHKIFFGGDSQTYLYSKYSNVL